MTPGRSTRLRTPLGKGAKWFLGIVVVAVVGALVPVVMRMLLPPEEVAAKLSDVSIDRDVTLQDFAMRHADERASVPRVDAIALIAASHAEAAVDADAAGGADKSVESEGATTTTGETTTTTEGTTTTNGETTTTDGGGTTIGRSAVAAPELSRSAVVRASAGVRAALDAPNVPELTFPADCLEDPTDPGCGLTSLQLRMEVAEEDGTAGDVSAETVERRLAQVFRGTRTRPAQSDPSKRELVGVTVNFNIAMTGLRGDTADVRWSLYSAESRVRVPRPWLRNQRALLLRPGADKDSASGEFWVPIPQVRGPFFIRIGVYDDDTRLDYADTPRFR